MMKSKSVEGGERRSLLFNEDWFSKEDNKEVYLRYYSVPFELGKEFNVPGMDGSSIEYAGSPFRVSIAEIEGQDYTTSIPWIVFSDFKNVKMHVEDINRVLPHTTYILISTPIRGEGGPAHQAAARKMDGFAGTLRLIAGNNLLRELVREAIVDVSTGAMRSYTKLVPIPTELEGPFATDSSTTEHLELAEATSTANENQKSRITLATRLVESAFLSEGPTKFFSYWVALEVAVDTHSTSRIIRLLSNAYGKKRSYIQNELGFDKIKETRNSVFHNGNRYEMAPDVERFLQCLFLDAARAKLGLSCREYMNRMIKAGFDTNRLDKSVGVAQTGWIER